MWNTECRHDADLMQTRRLRVQLDRQGAGRDNPQAVLPQAVLTKTSETICR